jgi:hypothetical protein
LSGVGHNGRVRLLADLEVDASPSSLFPWVEDLDRYPAWLGLVRSAAREHTDAGDDAAATGSSTATDAGTDAGGPLVWDVVLVGRIGPLRRLKRLRMTRVEHRVDDRGVGRARFVRDERDGARHAVWELVADVSATPRGARLSMALHYSGNLWAPPLQRLLDHEIDLAKPRLAALAQGGVPAP